MAIKKWKCVAWMRITVFYDPCPLQAYAWLQNIWKVREGWKEEAASFSVLASMTWAYCFFVFETKFVRDWFHCSRSSALQGGSWCHNASWSNSHDDLSDFLETFSQLSRRNIAFQKSLQKFVMGFAGGLGTLVFHILEHNFLFFLICFATERQETKESIVSASFELCPKCLSRREELALWALED